ncbi:24996_t:CDS:2 [Dentiscutata erythropus]|uniref:24996_t:CDS:1 n=1 Tax=Dentiscutata erythropus TaxID=1348616 RepID=A0A9N8W9E8_9GLOM|nr:24996_t:CDS:2 [Dentiscutata erythropus]
MTETNVNNNSSNYFLKYKKELWNINHFLDYRITCNDFSFTKSTEHLIYKNGIKKYLPRESIEQYTKAFDRDIKDDSYDNKWFAVEAFNNKEKKRQYEEMIKKLENIHITPDFPIRQYNKANGRIFNNIKDLEYCFESGRNVTKYLEIIYRKFKNEKSLFNVPEMSNIIECSDNSPLKKILKDDEWKEINENHSFHIDVDITISNYLNQLADFLCDDNNIINDDRKMPRPPDDNLRHVELKFYYKALIKLRILWRTLILLPDSNISEGSKERKINAKKERLYDEKKLVSKSDRGHRVDLIIRNILNMDLMVIEVVGPPHRRNNKKNLWDFRRGIRSCKDSYEKFVNNLVEKYGKWIDKHVIYNIYNQLEIYYVHVHGMKWYIWTVDHPGNQVYRARPLCEFNIPYKKKDTEDLYQYLRRHVNNISKFVEGLYEYLKQKARSNPNIIQDTKFAKILLDGCAITNPTPSSSPRDPPPDSNSTSSIEEALSSYIEKNIEELSDAENDWETPRNSDYELD